MKNNFEAILKIYADFAQAAQAQREKIALLQQNVNEYTAAKVERAVNDAEAEFSAYCNKKMREAAENAEKIIEAASKKENAFDIAELNGIINYVSATKSKADYKIIEKQLQQFRGIPQAIQAVLAVCENNECPPEVLGVVKSYNFNIDDISNSIGRNISSVFDMLVDVGEASRGLCEIAKIFGVDITTTNTDANGAAFIFQKLVNKR